MTLEPDRVVAALRYAGFDATQRGSLVAVDPPLGRAHLEPLAARRALAHTVYVPVYPEMSARALERLTRTLRAAALQEVQRPAVDTQIASRAEAF